MTEACQKKLLFCGHPELVEGSVPPQVRSLREYWVYILSNNAQVLYVGVTGNLENRIDEHLTDRDPSSFVACYNLDRLVYCAAFPTAAQAIAWEKKLKGWSREKKKRLIFAENPTWRNLLDRAKPDGTDPSTSSG